MAKLTRLTINSQDGVNDSFLACVKLSDIVDAFATVDLGIGDGGVYVVVTTKDPKFFTCFAEKYTALLESAYGPETVEWVNYLNVRLQRMF